MSRSDTRHTQPGSGSSHNMPSVTPARIGRRYAPLIALAAVQVLLVAVAPSGPPKSTVAAGASGTSPDGAAVDASGNPVAGATVDANGNAVSGGSGATAAGATAPG